MRADGIRGDTYRCLVVDESKRADQHKDASDENGGPGARRGRLARLVEDLSEKTHILLLILDTNYYSSLPSRVPSSLF